jgi:hypothetical protein
MKAGCPRFQRACFKHGQALEAGDVWRMRVEGMGRCALVGIGGQGYEPSRHSGTYDSTCWVDLGDGMARIYAGLSMDGGEHCHQYYRIPKTAPFDVALRCERESHVPQVQFNEDGKWHDFALARQGAGRVALKAGPWFPFLKLSEGSCVSSHRVDCPEPVL